MRIYRIVLSVSLIFAFLILTGILLKSNQDKNEERTPYPISQEEPVAEPEHSSEVQHVTMIKNPPVMPVSEPEVVSENHLTDIYFLSVDNGMVIVLNADKNSVYLNTGISVDMLPPDVAEEITDMKQISGKEELFDFLEAYTS